MSIVHMTAAAAAPPHLSISFSHSIAPPNLQLFLPYKPSPLSLQTTRKFVPIRMGGGPRTFPGGVSKWQWKRMQAKKAKQLLKARLSRERQIYEMRKRAELKAAVSDLERPWEAVEKAPKLFSVSADEQVKVLADRFQRPGGFDMWSERDGPELFKTSGDLPSARFFPKGVVHSVKPYGRISDEGGIQLDEFAERIREIQLDSDDGVLDNEKKDSNGNQKGRKNFRRKIRQNSVANSLNSVAIAKKTGSENGDLVKKMKKKQGGSTTNGVKIGGNSNIRRTPSLKKLKSEVYDMNLLEDGSFGL